MGSEADRVWELPGYVLLERIALGGRGEVYLAREGGDGGPLVAVKVLRPEDAQRQDRVQAFIDEVNVSKLLIHHNIVRVYHGDIHDNLPYLVMEHVDGLTLWDVNERARMVDQRLSHDVSAYMVAKTAEALDYAHNLTDSSGRPLNLVHRDVSAVNVMATFDGAIKLLDFGIAKSTIRQQRTAPGIIKGKLDYLSPEQCEGGEIDAVTDIYSLGVLLFELVTGTRPFVETDVATLFRKVSRGERPRARELRPDVPARLERIIDRAMATKRRKRYPSARAMLDDLNGFLASCRPPPTSTTIARLMVELAPDKCRQIAETYGPPETTAVSKMALPEAHFGDGDLEEPTIADYGMAAHMGFSEEDDEATTIERRDPPPHRNDTGADTVVEESPLGFDTPAQRKNRTALIVLAILALFSLATLAGIAVTIAVRRGQEPTAPPDGAADLLTNDAPLAEVATPSTPSPPAPPPEEPSPPTPAPSKSTPAAPSLVGTGRLRITVEPPGALISIGDERHEATDGSLVLTLPAGDHQVHVNARGRRGVIRPVKIRPGQDATLTVRLEAVNGLLTVTSRRRAMVFVGGRKIHLTPVENLELEPGLYDIRVRSRWGARRRRVRIVAGETESLHFDM